MVILWQLYGNSMVTLTREKRAKSEREFDPTITYFNQIKC